MPKPVPGQHAGSGTAAISRRTVLTRTKPRKTPEAVVVYVRLAQCEQQSMLQSRTQDLYAVGRS